MLLSLMQKGEELFDLFHVFAAGGDFGTGGDVERGGSDEGDGLGRVLGVDAAGQDEGHAGVDFFKLDGVIPVKNLPRAAIFFARWSVENCRVGTGLGEDVFQVRIGRKSTDERNF